MASCIQLISIAAAGTLLGCAESDTATPASSEAQPTAQGTEALRLTESAADPPTGAGSASAGGAGQDQAMMDCAALTERRLRLDCFDELAIVRGFVPPRTVSDEVGRWRTSQTINPMDDTTQVVIALTANGPAGRFSSPPVFYARCQSNRTEAYIDWDDYVGDDSSSVYQEWKYVTIRIGNQETERQQWGVSTDRRATFAPDWAGTLLRRMSREDQFIARITPYGENPVTAIFDVRGMEVALRPLAETCNWEIGPEP